MQVVASKNKIRYLHILIMLLITFSVGFLPPVGMITPVGMKVLGVFFGLVYGWIFIDLFWTSLFGFFALTLTGVTGIVPAFVQAFGNSSVVICIVAMAFADCLNKIGISEAIAYWTMSKKIFAKRPWLLCAGILTVSVLSGMFGCGYAAIFLLWAVVDRISDLNGIERKSLFLSMMYATILFAAMTGSCVTPFMAGFIMMHGFFQAATGLTVPGGLFLIGGIIYCILTFGLMLLISRFILRVDPSAFTITEDLRTEYASRKMSKVQLVGLILLAVYMAMLILPLFLHGTIWTMFGAWGMLGFTILYMSVFYIWKKDNGEPICRLENCFRDGIIWPSVMLLMITIPLSAAMESADIGILTTMNAVLAPIFNGLGVLPILILSVVLLGAITQILHNIVVAAIFIPLLAPIIIDMGCNPAVFFFVIYFSLQCAYVTPAASMMAGVLFGKEDTPVKHVYLYGLMFFVASCIVLLGMNPLCDILFSSFM